MQLKEWMEQQGLDQYETAALLGMTQPAVSRMLSGKAEASPTVIRAAFRISDGQVQPNDFYPDLFEAAA